MLLAMRNIVDSLSEVEEDSTRSIVESIKDIEELMCVKVPIDMYLDYKEEDNGVTSIYLHGIFIGNIKEACGNYMFYVELDPTKEFPHTIVKREEVCSDRHVAFSKCINYIKSQTTGDNYER